MFFSLKKKLAKNQNDAPREKVNRQLDEANARLEECCRTMTQRLEEKQRRPKALVLVAK